MTRKGFSKEQQNQLKQLVKDCSISRVSTDQIRRIAQEKLGVTVTDNWIGRIKRKLKQDSEKEFKYLIVVLANTGDNIAYPDGRSQVKEY